MTTGENETPAPRGESGPASDTTMPASDATQPASDVIQWRGYGHPGLWATFGVLALIPLAIVLPMATFDAELVVMTLVALLGVGALFAIAAARSTLDADGLRSPFGVHVSREDMSHLKPPGPWVQRVTIVLRDGSASTLPLGAGRTTEVARLTGLPIGTPAGFTPQPLGIDPDADPDELHPPRQAGNSAAQNLLVFNFLVQAASMAMQTWAGTLPVLFGSVAACVLLLSALALVVGARLPIADRSGIRRGVRTVPWNDIAYVKRSGVWDTGATAIRSDGTPLVTTLPPAMDRQLARVGRVPLGGNTEDPGAAAAQDFAH